MMLNVLASGSKGNCYILQNETEALILDCGVKPDEVIKVVGFNVSKIKGCLVSHVHTDHSMHVNDWMNKGIQCYTDESCVQSFELNRIKINSIHGSLKIGGFTVHPFTVPHDNCPCCGYIVDHEELGRLFYITDCQCVEWNLKPFRPNHLLVECNHQKELVDADNPNFTHVINGHMNMDTCKGFIKHVENDELFNIVLCHLSGHNANRNEIYDTINNHFQCNVYIAEKGLNVELQKSIF